MTRSLVQEVTDILAHSKNKTAPFTLASLARHFGVSNAVMMSCAREMVGRGTASPAYVTDRGVQVLHGLSPSTPVAQAATA
jgi:hypothetical protein